MKRRPSSGTTTAEVDRQLDNTAYDNVVVVKNNIASVVAVADSIGSGQLTSVITNLPEILLSDDNALIATTKANEASASAVAALASELSTANLLDQFDDRYLGNKAVAPLVDNDGNTLLIGSLYWDTVMNKLQIWDGVLWSDALTLTETSISMVYNKTIDSITNSVGANHIHYPIRNVSGVTINAGTIVTAQGTQSGTDYIEVVPVTNAQTQIALGVMHNTVANNGTGLCMNTGVSADIVDTSAWIVGTILYPSNTGGLTSTKPTTGIYQACAIVLRSHANQGTLLVEFSEPAYIASTTQAGQVQLNNTLTSTSSTQALTAAQGKTLQDGKQPLDATLTAFAALTTAADKLIYATGVDTFTTTTLSSFIRTLLDDVDAATARGTLGISATNTPSTAVGNIAATNVQSAIAELDTEKAPVIHTHDISAIVNTGYPTFRPSLNLDFANSRTVDPRITFTRASAGTIYNKEGLVESVASGVPRITFNPVTLACEGLLIEEARTNLLTHSNQFHNSVWTKVGSSVRPYSSTVDPMGGYSATKLVEDTSTGNHNTNRAVSYTSGTTYTKSLFAKAGERTLLELNFFSVAFTTTQAVVFDLTNKTATIRSGTPTYTISEAQNGFVRISITATATVTVTTQEYIQLVSTGTTVSYTGDGVSGLYIYGAQTEVGTFPTSYIPSTETFTSRASTATYYNSAGLLASAPVDTVRMTYNPTNLKLAPTMLLEDASSNLVLNSDVLATQSITVVSGTTYTLSFYGTGSVAISNAYTGSLVGIEPYPSRVSLTFTATTTNVTITITGTCQYGQLEASAFPTSYIPTTTAAVTRAADVYSSATATRAADVAYMDGVNFLEWYRQDEGSLLIDATCEVRTNDINPLYSITTGAGVPSIVTRIGFNAYRRIRSYAQSKLGVFEYAVDGPSNSSRMVKVAVSFSALNFMGVSDAGQALVSDITGILAQGSYTRLYVGSNIVSSYLNGTIKSLTYYPKRLTNTELQLLSTN